MTPIATSSIAYPVPGFAGLPGAPPVWLLIIVGVVAALVVAGIIVSRQRRLRTRMEGARERANGWVLRSIAEWERDGRITAAEATNLRAELTRPDFVAVIPHFGVHLTIGLFLRFPVGSITRASYTMLQIIAAHVRLVSRRIDRSEFQRARRIHTPLVLLVTCVPGIGTFAYLASQPFRANHLLLRVTADAVLLTLPRRLYERIGLRGLIARPLPAAVRAKASLPGLQLRVLPAQVAIVTLAVAGVLVALDLLMDMIDEAFTPTFLGWTQLRRITGFPNEASLATWYQVTLLLLCAVALFAITVASYRQRSRYRRHWGALALFVLGFSIDEQARFHDAGGDFGPRLREWLGTEGVFYYGWALVAFACSLAVGLAYRKFLLDLPATSRMLFIVAGGLYVGGEAGVEVLNGWLVDRQGNSVLYQALILLEELMGMVGAIIALTALLAYIETQVGIVRVSFGHQAGTPDPAPAMESGPALMSQTRIVLPSPQDRQRLTHTLPRR